VPSESLIENDKIFFIDMIKDKGKFEYCYIFYFII